MDVTSISNGDYIKVRNVDFMDGVTSFDARVSAAGSNAKIELHLDSQTGTSIGTCDVSGASSWTTKTCPVSGGSGKHDLFLKFTGGSGDLFKFNWWRFTGPTMTDADGGAGGSSGGTGGTVAGTGGGGGSGGAPGTGGNAGRGGTSGSGGRTAGSGGSMVAGSGGNAGSGGSNRGSGGASTTDSSGGATGSRNGSSGCSWQVGANHDNPGIAALFLCFAAALLRDRRRLPPTAKASVPRAPVVETPSQ
jgi:hypothetical protein